MHNPTMNPPTRTFINKVGCSKGARQQFTWSICMKKTILKFIKLWKASRLVTKSIDHIQANTMAMEEKIVQTQKPMFQKELK
jgi:hypothetical protein